MSESQRQLINHGLCPECRSFGPLRTGFTLVEALLAATILAIVAASSSLPFIAGLQQVNAAAELEQANALGEAMMEEVLARPFFEPGQTAPTLGPDLAEGNRLQFKSIDDFNGFSETAGNLKTFKNTNVVDAAFDGFGRTVSIEYVTFPNQEPSDVNSFIHIQVKVYHNTTLLLTLDRIVSREY